MKPTEAAALLTVAAAFDNRKPDADAAKAWAIALDGFNFEDCRTAIVAHYRGSSDWLMPQKVIGEVKRVRAKRVADYGPIEPPADIDPDDTAALIAWHRAAVRDIADGVLTEPSPKPAVKGNPEAFVALRALRVKAERDVREGLDESA